MEQEASQIRWFAISKPSGDVLPRFPPTDIFFRFPPTENFQSTSWRFKKKAKNIDVFAHFHHINVLSSFLPTKVLLCTSCQTSNLYFPANIFLRFPPDYRRQIENSTHRLPLADPSKSFFLTWEKNKPFSDIFRYIRLPKSFLNFRIPTSFSGPSNV